MFSLDGTGSIFVIFPDGIFFSSGNGSCTKYFLPWGLFSSRSLPTTLASESRWIDNGRLMFPTFVANYHVPRNEPFTSSCGPTQNWTSRSASFFFDPSFTIHGGFLAEHERKRKDGRSFGFTGVLCFCLFFFFHIVYSGRHI